MDNATIAFCITSYIEPETMIEIAKNNFSNFAYPKISITKSSGNSKAVKPKKEKDDKLKFIAASTVLSAAVIGGLLVQSSKKANSSVLPSQILKKYSSIKQIFDSYDFSAYQSFSKADFEQLTYLAAMEKDGSRIRNLSFPDVVFFPKLYEQEVSRLKEMLSYVYDMQSIHYKYYSNPSIFIKFLSSDFKSEKNQRTFLTIKNSSQLMEDLQKTKLQNQNPDLFKIFDYMRQNKISILTNDENFSKFLSQYNLNSLSSDYLVVQGRQFDKEYDTLQEILLRKELSSPKGLNRYLKNIPSRGFAKNDTEMLSNSLIEKQNLKNLVLYSNDSESINAFLEDLADKTSVKIEKINFHHASYEQIEEKLSILEKNFETSDAVQFLYIENYSNKNDNSQMEKLIDEWNKKYKTKIILSFDRPRGNIANDSFQIVLKDYLTLVDEKEENLLIRQASKIGFPYLDGSLKSELGDFIKSFLMFENGKCNPYNPNIAIVGTKKALDNTADSIKKLTQMHTKKLDCTKLSLSEFIQEFSLKLQSTDNTYEKTGKRTIIELDNFDKIFPDRGVLKKSSMPQELKNIIEKANENANALILAKTQKPYTNLELFEPQQFYSIIVLKNNV